MEINKIICGDCLEVMKGIPDKSIDFVFADPPYGINKAEWDTSFDNKFISEILRINKKGIAITCGQENIAECILSLGKEYKGILSARNKNGMTFNKIGFGNWIPVILAGKIKRGQDFFEFVVRGKKPNHPSPKPIEFMEKIVNRFTDKDDIILDPFLGSGTTAVACKELGRKYIGIEISPEYCEIARRRIKAIPELLPNQTYDIEDSQMPMTFSIKEGG